MKKILIYNSGGGLGDSIQLFTLILSLQNHFKTSEFFYLGAHENHFEKKLKDYNIKIKSLDLGIKYFGFRWWQLFLAKSIFNKNEFDKIDLIIDLQSKLRNTLILHTLPHNYFYSETFNFRFCSKKIKYKSRNHLENLSNFLNSNIKIVNFKLKNLNEKFKSEAKRLLPDKNYIGFSITQGNVYRKKSWAINKVIDLANKIGEKNKTPVFFIEKSKVDVINEIKSKVPFALFPELQSDLSSPALITAMSSRLDLAITIDNGIMHMISLANIPMLVIFGPTDANKFAPKKKDVTIIDSKVLYKSNNINDITVYDVFKLI